MWKGLPPLAALRAFEAAARHRSLSAAGRELGVTHAAVAQQLRALESHLGVALAFRDGRQMALTPEGAQLAAQLTEGFGIVARAVRNTAESLRGRPLQVTLTPSFASDWLMPRLGAFWARHPDMPIALHPTRRIVDLAREGMDLGIRFGDGSWPGVKAEMLVPAPYVVVGTPALVGNRKTLSPAELMALPWVIEEDWPEQLRWLADQGIDPARIRATRFATEELARAATRKGYGLHVEAEAIVADDVAGGRLQIVYRGAPGNLGYWAVTTPGYDTPALRLFLRWLRSVV